MSRGPTIIFAGGGSGGHISPGLAIAERLKEIAPDCQPIFVCSNRAIDAAMLRDAGADFVPTPASPPSIKPLDFLRFSLNFNRTKRLVKRLIRERRVSRVVTMGGFVAVPAVSAAKALGVNVLLVNLDAPPGKANLWMAKHSNEVVTAIALPTMPQFASRIVGMPIRKRALAPADAATCRQRLGAPPEKPLLLVTGASQGATSINAFMTALIRSDPRFFDGWHIHHLTGQGADAEIRDVYAAGGVSATVQPFLDQMGLAWGAAELAISRAGASSVAEAAQNAVPTLFLPYPYHKDMHQKHNAQPIVDAGGAVMAIDRIDAAANVREVSPVLAELLKSKSRRDTLRERLRAAPMPDAAMTIARMLVAG